MNPYMSYTPYMPQDAYMQINSNMRCIEIREMWLWISQKIR